MKQRLIVRILFVCSVLSASLTAQTLEDILVNKERSALDRWCTGDTRRFTELGAGEVTYFAEGSDTLIVGYQAFAASNKAIEGTFTIPKYEMLRPRVVDYGMIGILTYVLLTYDEEGNITSRWRSSEIYRQMADDWKLVHSHWTLIR